MNVQGMEMQRVLSEITSTRAHADPSACIRDLNPLLNTAEGRRFLSKQEGEKAMVLIDLFDWVIISISALAVFPRGLSVFFLFFLFFFFFFQVLGSREIPVKKGCVLWTLRQLCACLETLPKSYLLEIDFKPTDPHHMAGGFADVWRGAHNGSEVAFKSIRRSIRADEAARLRLKVRHNVFLSSQAPR